MMMGYNKQIQMNFKEHTFSWKDRPNLLQLQVQRIRIKYLELGIYFNNIFEREVYEIFRKQFLRTNSSFLMGENPFFIWI